MSDQRSTEGSTRDGGDPPPLERIEAVGARLSAAFDLFLREAKNPKTSPERVAEIAAFVERAEQMLAPPVKPA